MAGDIWVTREKRWPVNSSLYTWVLDFLVEQATSVAARTQLEEIRDENLGLVVLDDFSRTDRYELLEIIRDRLVPDAVERVPRVGEYKDFLDELQRLAAMAATDRSAGER